MGTVVFETDRTDIALTGEIADQLLGEFSPEIPVILRSIDNHVNIQASDSFRGVLITPGIRLYVTFFAEKRKYRGITVPVI